MRTTACAAVYVVCAGSLAFSVVVFTGVALATIAIILLRRFCLSPAQELGGSKPLAFATAGSFLFLYCIYLTFSILRDGESVPAFNSFLATNTITTGCS